MQRPTIAVLVGVTIAAVVNKAVALGLDEDISFNVGRAVISFVGGWFIVSHGRGSLWTAALVGPLVMLIDHVLLKGGYFVLAHFFWPAAVEGEGLLAALGVIVSFVMFAPIAAICSWIGGFLARRRTQRVQAHP